MDSKLTRLRSGKPVEFEKGVYGRLNPQKKSIEFSDGLTIDVSHDKDYFPQNPQQAEHSQRIEKLQSSIGKNPLGEFGHQLSERGLPKAVKDTYQFLTQTGEEYEKNQRARREVSERIAEESPYTSMAATATSFIPDILATRGLGAAATGAVLPALHAGPRLVTEPGEVAKESALGLGTGFLLGKAEKFLGNVAARRGASQEVKRATAEIPALNAAGKEATAMANREQALAYGEARSAVERENASLLSQHQAKVNEAKERALNAKNAYDKATFDRKNEIFQKKQARDEAKIKRSADQAQLEKDYQNDLNLWEQESKVLKEQADLAEKQYKEALKNQPKLQREVQEEYGKEVIKTAHNIGKAFHAESKIYPAQLGVGEFLDKSIRKGSLAGLAPEKNAERIIKGLFPEGKSFSGRELSKKYEVLEKAIASSNPEVAGFLNEFKTHLGEKLPTALADNIAYRSILPSFRTKLFNEINSSINSIKLPKGSQIPKESLLKTARTNADLMLASVNPENFIEKMRSGEFRNLLHDNILKETDIISDYLKLGNLKKLKSQDLQGNLKKTIAYEESMQFFNEFLQNFGTRLDNQVAQTELKIAKALQDSEKKLAGKIEGTFGTAPKLEAPARPVPPELRAAPQQPEALPEIPPIQEPPLIPPVEPEAAIPRPELNAMPQKPTPQQFTPQVAPTLPPAEGLAQGIGDVLEKPILGGKGLINNPLTKLAGLKYLLGKGALPLEAGYAGLKGLTSPTAAGEVARQSFKTGGILAIAQLAEKYPSYHNGILEDPRERRSLNKEIEEDPEIPMEQKAIIQSKINRGRSLFERL